MVAYSDTRNLSKGNVRLTSTDSTALIIADQYYPVEGVFSNGLGKDFVVAGDGTVYYNGPAGRKFVFIGVSDVSVNKPCKITYVLQQNGEFSDTIITERDFAMADRTDGLAIARLIQLYTGDVLRTFAKSSVAATDMTAHSLFLLFIGEN